MSTTVHFEIQIDPGKRADAPRILSETLAATRAWPGNEGVEALVDDVDPCRVVVVEKWATTKDHDDYSAWRTTSEGRNGLGAILAGAPFQQTYSTTIPLVL